MQTSQQELISALEIIEQACRDQPYCAACGQHTGPVARDGGIWLECPSWTEHKSLLARIISFQAGHIRRLLIDESTTTPVKEAS